MNILRACIVQQGRVLEERRLEPGEPLTIGSGPKNTFVTSDPIIGTDDVASFALVAQRNGAYELVLGEGMTTKLLVGEHQELDTDGLRAAGLLRAEGGATRVRLSDQSRGRVHAGAYTVIFQFVPHVPTVELLTLPKEFKPNYLKNLDRFYASTLTACAIAAVLLIFYFYAQPQPSDVTFETMDERFARMIVPDYVPVSQKEADKPAGDLPTEKKEQPKAKDKVAKNGGEGDATQSAGSRAEKIRKGIEGRGVLAILGTRGAGASGAVADVFGSGTINSDLETAFHGISGVGVAQGSSARTSRGNGAGGTGDAASIGGLATSGGGKVGLGGKQEARVAAVKAETPEVDGSLDSDAIANVVRARLRSIQDCYERELKRNASLTGKIEIEFTIGSDGSVEDARVSNNKMGSAEVGDCVVSRVRRWKFPQPSGGHVTVNYPFIFTPAG